MVAQASSVFDHLMSMGSRAMSLFHSSNKKGREPDPLAFSERRLLGSKRVQAQALRMGHGGQSV